MRMMMAALAAMFSVASAQAQPYPSRPITVVVPFPAGGPSDVVARIVAEQMGKVLGQSLVIENVGGAGGSIGSARVAAVAPDGYTLLAASMGSHVAAPILVAGARYDPLRDFEPIGLTAHAPVVIVARKDFPAKDLTEFVASLKQKSGDIKQGHGGVGASSHMACLLFTAELGVHPNTIAYRGTGPAMNDLLGGHIDFLCEQAVSVIGQITSGAVKAYAVSGDRRLVTLPEVPTAAEAGVNYRMSVWAAMFAPRRTPPDIVKKLNAALDQALDDPSVQKRVGDLGGTVPAKGERSAEAFAAYLKAEVARWSPILKAASGN
ncbi:MAG: tripartite tricarboxylate transporter substrate binding protein BugD [Alphaproteobacteria bacterium]|nr:MAG: tripartite tricarboxylate transporter substrate binding protein BugD [Alphaproteobacteria bacterium]